MAQAMPTNASFNKTELLQTEIDFMIFGLAQTQIRLRI